MNGSEFDTFDYFDIQCPRGGDHYICKGKAVEFVGCCVTNPCLNGGICEEVDLRTTTFNGDLYAQLPKLDCDVSSDEAGNKSAADWYTCAAIDPPFMGCCEINPCQNNGCPQANLTAARLTTYSTSVNKFLYPNGTTNSSDTATASANPDNDGYSLSTGAIVGIAVGGAVAALFALGLIFWFCVFKPRKQKRESKATEAQQPQLQQQQTNHLISHPASPAPDYSQTPMSQHQSSFGPHTPVYPSGVSSDGFNKVSPYAPDRPVSTTVSDVSSVYGRQPYHPGYSPVPMVPVQEMDGAATTAAPQELGTGQEHSISPDGPPRSR